MTNVQGPVTEAAAILNAVPGVQGADKYVDRHTFELQTIVDRMGTDISLWDLGGGLGVFALAAQKLGMRATVVDDFYDLGDAMEPVLATLAEHDVQVVRSELPAPLDFDQDIDVVTSFHTIEHLHNSPRDPYKQVAAALAPWGAVRYRRAKRGQPAKADHRPIRQGRVVTDEPLVRARQVSWPRS